MDHYYWFALRSVPHVGNVLFRRLVERFGSPERVLKAPENALVSVKGVSPAVASSIRGHDWRLHAERECEAVAQAGVRIVTMLDEGYPQLLLQIPDPPAFLYVRGEIPSRGAAVAMVGSRRASAYGRTVTEKMAEELARHDVTVVSGMARGVDTAAHRGALKGGGATVGVLGCGVDVVYPPENRALCAEMAAKGALVSEFPMGTLPLAENFPKRNRIISGMAHGVLIVEAAENSGSLITARLALDQGRDVFAIPGNITSTASRGTNRLIREGAKLVASIEDILEELPQKGMRKGGEAPPAGVSLAPDEAGLYRLLAEEPLHIDDIIVRSALTVGEVSAILLRLELKGAVTQLPGKYFSLS